MPINGRDPILDKFLTTILNERSSQLSNFYYDDPTTLGFSLFFAPQTPLFNVTNDGKESAYNYLISVGENGRADHLLKFLNILNDLVNLYPYFFTKLTGLENIYTLNPEVAWESDRKITIETLEAIDTRVGSMIEHYIAATYDIEYRRQVVPNNLLWFDLHIMVSEIRKIRSFVNGVTGANTKGGTGIFKEVGQYVSDQVFTNGGGAAFQNRVLGELGLGANKESIKKKADKVDSKNKEKNFFPYNMTEINKNLTCYKFVFERCTFLFTESQTYLSEVNNSDVSQEAKNKIQITAGKLYTDHSLKLLDIFADYRKTYNSNQLGKSENPSSWLEKRFDDFVDSQGTKLTGFFKKEADIFLQQYDPRLLAARAINIGITKLDSKFKSFLFGNVFTRTHGSSEGGAGLLDDGVKYVLSKIFASKNLNPDSFISREFGITGKAAAPGTSVVGKTYGISSGNAGAGEMEIKNINDTENKDILNPDTMGSKDVSNKNVGPLDKTISIGNRPINNPDTMGSEKLPEVLNKSEELTIDLPTVNTNSVDKIVPLPDVNGSTENKTVDLPGIQNKNVEIIIPLPEIDRKTGNLNVGDPAIDGRSTNKIVDLPGMNDISVKLNVPQPTIDESTVNKKVDQPIQSAGTINQMNVGDQPIDGSIVNKKIDVNTSFKSGKIKNIDIDGISNAVLSANKANIDNKADDDILKYKSIKFEAVKLTTLIELGVVKLFGIDLRVLDKMGVATLGDFDFNAVKNLPKKELEKFEKSEEIYLSHIDVLKEAPVSAILEKVIKSHMANVITEEKNTTGIKSLGTVKL